ncbi:MAG: hypothetical protein HY332_16950 [Chloroflexi bacterium]|nr:hypothetical protein [Chloroflexota bacterium]
MMPTIAQRRRLVLVPVLVLLTATCAPAAAKSGGIGTAEQRLLPGIIHRQEARVRDAAKAVAAAEDKAAALRLRQRILTQYGRPDLAGALDAQAAATEAELHGLRQRLADEEAALAAYRDYAARAGVHIGPPSRDGEERRAARAP